MAPQMVVSDSQSIHYRYILPSLSRIPNDDEEWIRIAYAAAMGPLASAAYGFLSSQKSGNSSEVLVSTSSARQSDTLF